jgi:phosphatidylglycerophosphate synthase
MNEYRYNCTDKSIILPYFKDYYVSFYFRFVPHALTANTITVFSTAFVMLMLTISICFEGIDTGVFSLLFALCLHNYLVGDHLDGMQAKNTNTSSPLGEYMDHYLDVYNGAVVVYVLTVFLAPIPGIVFFCFLVLNSLSFAITMVEELETGELIFGKVGTLEGLIILILFFLTWQIPAVREFWMIGLVEGYARFWVVIAIFALGYLGTLADVIWRIGYIPRQFLVFTLSSMLLAFGLFNLGTGNLLSWVVITLTCGEYISKVMESYLIGKKHKYPDPIIFVVALAIVLLQLWGVLGNESLKMIVAGLTGYLALRVVWLFVSVLSQLRGHWLWLNPKKTAQEPLKI